MKHLYLLALSLIFLLPFTIHAQDRAYVHQIVNKLSAPNMHGRGYVKQGDLKAARLLAAEMEKAGLKAFGDDYFQYYSFGINTFPSKMYLQVDGKKLRPGTDFVISLAATTTKEVFDLVWLPDTVSTIESAINLIDTIAWKDKLIVLPQGMTQAYRRGLPGVRGVVVPVEGNVWWHASGARNPNGKLNIMLKADLLPKGAKKIKLNIESEFIENHQTQNLLGYLPGQAQPDSFFVFIAHYDHLGRMGKNTYFPGANDNASGSATVLDLARYYAANPHKVHYTMVFLLVSGEEAGLLGSFYNSENPLFPLENIKFLINMDMVGTGSEGLGIVNGKLFPEQFALLDSLNKDKAYFADLRAGGESCNSDHCAYYLKGVPSFFIFTRGNENREYHNVYDTPNRIPFTRYEQLFGLLTDFVTALQTR
jgi:aminopeptidase YwaD